MHFSPPRPSDQPCYLLYRRPRLKRENRQTVGVPAANGTATRRPHYRILLNHLKAKFVAIGIDLAEFESEFMAHLVITDKAGRPSTMDEVLLPRHQQNPKDTTMPKFLLGDRIPLSMLTYKTFRGTVHDNTAVDIDAVLL